MLYYIIYPILYLFSLLPMRILYVYSEIFAFVLYDIVRYRRKVVRNNLSNAFPDKSMDEIIRIEKKFYSFFTQWIVESIKLTSISKDELKKRCSYTENFYRIFDHCYNQKKDIVALMGHYGNWEWAGASFHLYFKHHLRVLYHPLSNATFNKIMKKIRTRLGMHLLPMHSALKFIIQNKSNDNAYTFVADQSPSLENSFWMSFLHQDTAVYYVPEKISKKINAVNVAVIVYPQTRKGYYLIDAQELNTSDHHQLYPVMYQFMKILEENIQKRPEYWLWSHKRWKLKKTNA